MDRESSTHSQRWDVMGSKLPKSEIVYFCQMMVVYVFIVTSIVNLSLQNGKNELSDFGSLLPITSHRSLCVLLSRSMMSSSLYSLLSSYEFQLFSIVFLQLFSTEVFQDVAERTVLISLSTSSSSRRSSTYRYRTGKTNCGAPYWFYLWMKLPICRKSQINFIT
jgi:hypothetical protein